MEKIMAKEYFIIVILELNMMGNLLMVNFKDMENIYMKMENIILVNGIMIKCMVKGLNIKVTVI